MATPGRAAINGLNGFLAVMHKLKRGAELDDPYADWWMLQVEEKLADTRAQLDQLRQQVDRALAGAPEALTLGDNRNLQPVELPLFVNAQLGFMAVYLLADYDALARRLILAHHTALIDRRTLERWLNEGGHALRSLFAMVRSYRHAGVTRTDFAAHNARARRIGQPGRTAGRRTGGPPPLAFCPTHCPARRDPHSHRDTLRRRFPGRLISSHFDRRFNRHRDRHRGPDGRRPDRTSMTGYPSGMGQRRFVPLQPADYQSLEQAAYLKGLLQPFKGKGSLEHWARQCRRLRDELIRLSQQRILSQTQRMPFSLLEVQLSQQATAAGTCFLRWRNLDRSAMGVALWEALMAAPSTPNTLIDDLYRLEQQRIVLNMQISLCHSLARQAHDCASKLARAETVWRRRRQSPHPQEDTLA